jgi:hypothetical protein
MRNSRWRWLMGVALLVMCVPAAVSAQSTTTSGASQSAQKEAAAPTPVKLEIVLSEYDGAKKIGSLTYTVPVIANGDRPSGAFASLRVGVRVPVTVSDEKKGENALQYIDVGTNIDARVAHADDGRYQLDMTVDRSSLYVATREQGGSIVGKEWSAGDAPPGNPPMVRQYRGGLGLFVREGQATEATVATDPVTGHVLKVEVTLSVVK